MVSFSQICADYQNSYFWNIQHVFVKIQCFYDVAFKRNSGIWCIFAYFVLKRLNFSTWLALQLFLFIVKLP